MLKCAQCVTEWKTERLMANGDGEPGVSVEDLPDAITWAPAWVSQSLGGGQMIMAAVPSPTCEAHLAVDVNATRAAKSGLQLG